MKPIRVGIIGCGWIAQTVHIPAYIENPKSRLVAICDANKERLDEFARKYKIQNTYSDYQELLQSSSVDAVSICTPTALHSKVAVASAKSGVHVLCEKPLASNLEEAQEIVQALSQSRIKFMVGYNYRFLPNHVKAKEFLDDGRIGKPIFIKGEVVTAGPYKDEIDEKDYAYETKKRMGAFFDLGSHLADLFIWMMGQPKEVCAAFSTHTDNVSVDDSAAVLIKFKSDVLGSITISWLNLPDYQAMANSRIIEIIGSKGAVDSEFYGPSLYFYSSNSITSKIKGKIRITPVRFNPKVPDEALQWSYKKEIDCFLESIINDEKPPIPAGHGLNVLRLVVSAYESARSKSVVVLE